MNRPAVRSRADRVLAQGTVGAVTKAFGSSGGKMHPQVWNAFHSSHAPLPRSVGPYTVVRTTLLHTSSAANVVIATMQHDLPYANTPGILKKSWSQWCVAEVAGAGAIGSTGATKFFKGNPPGNIGGDSTFTCCPSAISVQVMCPTALQTASGTVAAAVCPVRLDLSDDGRSWAAIQQDLIAFMRPRLMTAGKLALRGVQLDSYPLSMAACSEFLPMKEEDDSPEGTAWTAGGPHPIGWAPFMFYNGTGQPLQYLITTEWRVRFDIGHPAVSSHTHHGVSTDVGWDHHIRKAIEVAPGVIDIVERIANSGVMARAAQAMAMV